MTDGLYIDTTNIRFTSGEDVTPRLDGLYLGVSQDEAERVASGITFHPQIDLTTFSQWIEFQPISTHIGLLELIANDLYRRRDYPMIAGRVKDAARDLRAMARLRDE